MNARVLAKRKSETNVIEGNLAPQNKRLLTERIAAGMGVLRLSDLPSQDAQGNTRPPFQRTISTPSNVYYGPSFTPSRPDLVSSFELNRPQPTNMDEDMMEGSLTPQTSYVPTTQQQCITVQQPHANSIYSQANPLLLNNAPRLENGALVINTHPSDSYPNIIDEEKDFDVVPKFKLLIPKLPPPSLEIPLLHNIIANPSRALILYTPPKEVVAESLARTNGDKTKEKDQEKDTSVLTVLDPCDLMMLD